jgi:hypothetical protein
MPAIFDALYREYCRARLAEMRKQLSIVKQHPAGLDAGYDRADQDGIGRINTQQEIACDARN